MKAVNVEVKKNTRKEAGRKRSVKNTSSIRDHLEKEGILSLLNKKILLKDTKSQ